MNVDDALVQRLARLAGLRLGDDELPAIRRRIESMLGLVEAIANVPLDPESPGTSVTTPVTRPDVVSPSLAPDVALGNASATRDAHFEVPASIEDPR